MSQVPQITLDAPSEPLWLEISILAVGLAALHLRPLLVALAFALALWLS